MTDSNEAYPIAEKELASEIETSEVCYVECENEVVEKECPTSPVYTFSETKPNSVEFYEEEITEKNDDSASFIRTILTSKDSPKNSIEVFKKLISDSCTTVTNENVCNAIFGEKLEECGKTISEESRSAIESDAKANSEEICVESFSANDVQITFNPDTKKVVNLPQEYADYSHSSSSKMQLSSPPFDSVCSPQKISINSNRIDFENAIPGQPVWRKCDEFVPAEGPVPSKPKSEVLDADSKLETSNIPVITLDDSMEPATEDVPQSNLSLSCNETDACILVGPVFSPLELRPKEESECQPNQSEIKPEDSSEVEVIEPQPVVPPPAPRKRGRPRKQVLPNPSPLVESWGPGAQEFMSLSVPTDPKRSTRYERKVKKKRFEEEENEKQNGDDDIPKKRYSGKTAVKKKKKRSTYVPKKKGPQPKKKQPEMENIQNFEEETRMSASESQGGFPSRSGPMGDESQGSFLVAEGQTKTNTNKKGRMEVMTNGCKPITVQQIVEYNWPPPSSIHHGEKPEGLMIQEQITEYLGVKSFKRKYPSIKRRPVDMEERNYLQENGFVSENMCDLGLTAVYSADIVEIMYNDFPHKFEEYRKYTREKKAKEQRALREKQAAERADTDPLKEAVESAQSWNTEFNRTRREKRTSCFDLQTFTVQFPANRYKRISLGKPGNYPVALIPGQNTDYYKRYTSNELKYFPLNTVLYGPVRPNERHFALPGGSEGSQSEIDDSSSSDESSSSSSEETQDTEETSSTMEEEKTGNVEVKLEKEIEEKESPKPQKVNQKTPKGRGRGKSTNLTNSSEPKKRLGRPPKLKLTTIRLKRLEEDEISNVGKDEKVVDTTTTTSTTTPTTTTTTTLTTTRVIIHTCKMCHEEESKNKNGEFEGFIECTQCKGKIHPSCIDLTAEMIPKICSYGWQCTDCKSCVKCGQSSNEDKMIFCDQCDRGYHIFCVGLNEVPSGNYICLVCKPSISVEEPAENLPEIKLENFKVLDGIKEDSSEAMPTALLPPQPQECALP